MPVGVTAGDISICLPLAPTAQGAARLPAAPRRRRMNVAKCPKWGRGIGCALPAVPDSCFQQFLVLYALWSARQVHEALRRGARLGGLGCPEAFSRNPKGCYVEKRESCHWFSHPSVPGEGFLVTRNHTFKLKR